VSFELGMWCGKRKEKQLAFVWQMKEKLFFVRFSTGILYQCYWSSHLAHIQGVKQDQK
jgi:hypothetical protein